MINKLFFCGAAFLIFFMLGCVIAPFATTGALLLWAVGFSIACFILVS